MHTQNSIFRLTAAVVAVALLVGPARVPVAWAQNETAGTADPPGRVGRLARITGTVSFHTADQTDWEPATLNYPVTSGNAFWTEPASGADLGIGSSLVALNEGTEFDLDTLDDHTLAATLPQGAAYLRLRVVAAGEQYQITTPRGVVTIAQPGQYEVVAGDTNNPTLVNVVSGQAQVAGTNLSLAVGPNQSATISGTDTYQGTIGALAADPFLTAHLTTVRPVQAVAQVAPPPVVAQMTGGDVLVDSGTWAPTPQYGNVWYPPVEAGWVPYRHGHWAYVAPWGWTWVDDASWGFAPFHYGRWVQIEGRWAWTPGEVRVDDYRPVYAPALVTFIGIGAGIAIGAAIASGSIGWVPLGPHEEYHPWYHASNNYVRQVNITHVTNITNITNNNVTINNYVNRGAATSVPAAAMTASRPVQAVARPVTPQEFAAARPITGQQPLRPTAATAGVTPVVARQMSLAPAPAAVHAAPGPAVRPAAAGTAGFARPTFAPVEKAQAPAATEPGRPVPATPGARPAVTPAPEAARPATTTPTPPHPAPSTATRPETARPETARPEAVRPETARPEAARPETARPAAAPHPEAAASHPVARPAPRPEARPEAAPRPEARPAGAPHPEARPEAAPRPEARPEAAPHPEARPAQAPQERKKEPGEK